MLRYEFTGDPEWCCVDHRNRDGKCCHRRRRDRGQVRRLLYVFF